MISFENHTTISIQKWPVFQLAIVYCCYRKLCTVVTENWHPAYTVQLIAIDIEGGNGFRRWVVPV